MEKRWNSVARPRLNLENREPLQVEALGIWPFRGCLHAHASICLGPVQESLAWACHPIFFFVNLIINNPKDYHGQPETRNV